MRPKELQAQLGITADRIKLYKREELFFRRIPPPAAAEPITPKPIWNACAFWRC